MTHCRLIGFLLMLACSATSCLKKDDAVVLPAAGEGQVATVNIEDDYSRQVYFKLQTTDTVCDNITAWDLAFDAGASGYHVWINGGKGVLVSQALQASFQSVNDTTGLIWKFDSSDWHPDSTAIGNWNSQSVYVIDRGAGYSDFSERFYKIRFDSVDVLNYYLTAGSLFDSAGYGAVLSKNSSVNYLYYSLGNQGETVNPEPEKSKWDFVFTRYRHIYHEYNPPFPYIVNGLLLNPAGTLATTDSTAGYQNIDYNYAKGLTYSARRNAIGFEWKYFDFNTQHYVVRPELVYIIKTQAGYYYKLHFIGFYNNQGLKGFPKFEYQRL